MNSQFLLALRQRIARVPNDPCGPALDRQEHVVKIKPPIIKDDYDRLVDARAWCSEQVDHEQGHLWSYRRVVQTDGVEFSFSNDLEAMMFRMFFG